MTVGDAGCLPAISLEARKGASLQRDRTRAVTVGKMQTLAEGEGFEPSIRLKREPALTKYTTLPEQTPCGTV